MTERRLSSRNICIRGYDSFREPIGLEEDFKENV